MKVSLEQYRSDLKRFGPRPVIWELDMQSAVALCGIMQLALRHPHMEKSPSAALARKHILDFIECVPAEFQHIKNMLRMGFHSKYDS